MTSRETVLRAIRFQGTDRIPCDFPPQFGSDFHHAGLDPHPDRPGAHGLDEWGVAWAADGHGGLAPAAPPPLGQWSALGELRFPNLEDPRRYRSLVGLRERVSGKFLLGRGIAMFARARALRGPASLQADVQNDLENLRALIDRLADMNLALIRSFAAAGLDGILIPENLGVPLGEAFATDDWRLAAKPACARIFQAAHDAGLATFLHWPGRAADAVEDLIDIGLDVIRTDTAKASDLELLGSSWGGRITFYASADAAQVMPRGSADEIRDCCRQMVEWLWRANGGFIPHWNMPLPHAACRPEAVETMCGEFLKISRQMAKDLRKKTKEIIPPLLQ